VPGRINEIDRGRAGWRSSANSIGPRPARLTKSVFHTNRSQTFAEWTRLQVQPTSPVIPSSTPVCAPLHRGLGGLAGCESPADEEPNQADGHDEDDAEDDAGADDDDDDEAGVGDGEHINE